MTEVTELKSETTLALRKGFGDPNAKASLIGGASTVENVIPLLLYILCICLIICFISVFGATVNADVYQLKTKSVCTADPLRCSCDLNNGEWPIATKAFYNSPVYDQASADWYASTQGWIFDPTRGICPLGAVQVWVTLSGKLQWQGSLSQYNNDYSSGDTNVRRLTGVEYEEGNETHFEPFGPNEAAEFLKQNTDTLSALVSDLSEMLHYVMMKVGLGTEKAPLELEVGGDAPAGHHRQLKLKSSSSSSSSSKPKPKVHYNYRFCLRKEYSDQIKEVWATADATNAATGAVTDGKSFVSAYSDFEVGQTLITATSIITSLLFFPYVFLFYYAMKYEYTGYGGPKLKGKGMFPFTAALALCIVFVVLAGSTSKAIDKNDFLTMPKSGWGPFLPGCTIEVATSTATSYVSACVGMGITIIVLMVGVLAHYIYRRAQPKSQQDIHEESLLSVDPKVPYLMDSAKPKNEM